MVASLVGANSVDSELYGRRRLLGSERYMPALIVLLRLLCS